MFSTVKCFSTDRSLFWSRPSPVCLPLFLQFLCVTICSMWSYWNFFTNGDSPQRCCSQPSSLVRLNIQYRAVTWFAQREVASAPESAPYLYEDTGFAEFWFAMWCLYEHSDVTTVSCNNSWLTGTAASLILHILPLKSSLWLWCRKDQINIHCLQHLYNNLTDWLKYRLCACLLLHVIQTQAEDCKLSRP